MVLLVDNHSDCICFCFLHDVCQGNAKDNREKASSHIFLANYFFCSLINRSDMTIVTGALIFELLIFLFLNVVQTIALVLWVTLYMKDELHLSTWKNWFYAWLGTLAAIFLLSFFVYYEILWTQRSVSIHKNRSILTRSDDEYV